ncbi:hypothetical protein BH11MYX3_BH11MYX3_37850 [soil metagenome]
MLLGLALLVGMGGLIGGVGILLPRLRRPFCPVCVRRTAELISRRRGYLYAQPGSQKAPGEDKDRSTFFEARYRCGPCKLTLVQRDGGALVTEAAWEAGIQALPPATIVDRR